MKSFKKHSSHLQVSFKYLLREYAEAFFYAILLAVFLRTFVVTAYRIPTSAMYPSLMPGDFIFGYKLPFGVNIPFMNMERLGGRPAQRGEIIIFTCPESHRSLCVRRVIGIPGDRIEIAGKRVKVNSIAAQYRQVVVGEKRSEDSIESEVFLEEKWESKSYPVVISSRRDRESFGPVVVPPSHIFVLSDDRDQSEDSRSWGMIPAKNLEAVAGWIWLSLTWEKEDGRLWPKVRWSRVLRPLD